MQLLISYIESRYQTSIVCRFGSREVMQLKQSIIFALRSTGSTNSDLLKIFHLSDRTTIQKAMRNITNRLSCDPEFRSFFISLIQDLDDVFPQRGFVDITLPRLDKTSKLIDEYFAVKDKCDCQRDVWNTLS